MRLDVHIFFHDAMILERIEKGISKLLTQGEKSMSKISEFYDKQKEYNDRMDAAVQGVSDDVKALADKITQLQESAGQISPEDQALLDELQSHAESAVAKLEALDGMNAPTPPTDVPPGEGGEPTP